MSRTRWFSPRLEIPDAQSAGLHRNNPPKQDGLSSKFNAPGACESKENLARNEVGDVRVVSGLVADASHCPHGVPFYGVDEELHGETGPAIRLPREMSYEGMSYNVESCFSLPYLASRFGTPSVLFADCEGCLPSIFRQFPSFFSRPELRMIIYEMDGDLYSYKKLHEALVEAGFKMLEFGFVCVWSRNLIPVLNLWPVYHKLRGSCYGVL